MSQDSEGYRQIEALLGLAWNNCARDIAAVVNMYIGMLVFIAAFLVLWLLNMVQFLPFVTMPDINIAGTTLSYVILSAVVGFCNAVAMLTFLAIVVILFEYSLSFTTVCYYYDNKSWAVPRLIRDAVKRLAGHSRSEREENRQADRKYRIFLENEINKIHNGFVEEPKKE
jgi:hypothetical protein